VAERVETRGIERRLARRWLPPALDSDRKQGFSVPLDTWFREAGPEAVSEGKRRNGATRGSVITLRTRSTTMTRMEARDLVKRIQVLPDAEQTRILSRVMQAEGKKVAWSEVEAIQQRMGKLDVDDERFTREIVEAVREVRRERRRKSRS
jgi:hypothetical protein